MIRSLMRIRPNPADKQIKRQPWFVERVRHEDLAQFLWDHPEGLAGALWITEEHVYVIYEEHA